MHGTDPLKADSDSDGLTDPIEIAYGTNPIDADGGDDGLKDGDYVEFVQNSIHTLPLTAFKNPAPGTKQSILLALGDVENLALKGNVSAALKKLADLLKHLDGCGTQADKDD